MKKEDLKSLTASILEARSNTKKIPDLIEKLEDEAGNKALEAEGHYRACVDESNSRHRNLLDVKSQV